jgi:flavin-dependent dehydrogenase
MRELVYDSAIIGGGLAGLALSIELAKLGRKVILIEKESYPFSKVCGEYISMESYDYLKRLGLPLDTMDISRINKLLISAPDGSTLERPLKLGGFGISRYTLDAKLAKLAEEAGVTLWQSTSVENVVYTDECFQLTTTKGLVKSKVAAGAYGKRSALDRKLNRLETLPVPKEAQYIGVKYHVKLDFPSDRIELHNFENGYCGISKVDQQRYCLCYLTHADNLRKHNQDIKKMEKEVLMKNPFLKKYFTEAQFLNELPLTISQITFHVKSAVHEHILMLGDAAGNIAPLSGNGMSLALRSAYLAAVEINFFLTGTISREKMEERYARKWKNNFDLRIRSGKYLQALFGKKSLTIFTIRLLRYLPWVTDGFIRLTHGRPF